MNEVSEMDQERINKIVAAIKERLDNSSSKYKGVCHLGGSRWVARIKVSGRTLYLGMFGFESDAAICHNYHAAHCFGEFAQLNKIDEYFHD